MVVAAPSDSAGPGGAVVRSSVSEWFCRMMAAATMTTITNSGTNTVAKFAMALMPNTTSSVMPRPVMMAQKMYSGVIPAMMPGRISCVPRKSVNGTISAMPWPNTAFCTPNQPTMEIATTPPNRADPTLPNPVQRDSRLVDKPSRAAAVPSAQLTT